MSLQSQSKSQASFTLVELLITLAIIAVLMTVIIISINPSEMMKRNRDVRRLADLNSLNKAIQLFQISFPSASLGDSNTVYISLPDTSSTCSNLGLPPLPSGWSYKCSSPQNYRKIDGTGWIPLNFASMDIGSPLATLPIDPTNSTSSGNYYTYVVGGSWEFTAMFESDRYADKAINDGDAYPGVYSLRTSTSSLTPGIRDKGLVGYWKFDEGSGTTAYDSSGYNNHGTLYNGPTWATGKVGGALSFDGVNDYVGTLHYMDLANKDFTMIAWVKINVERQGGDHSIFLRHYYGGQTCGALHFVIRNSKPYYGLYGCDFMGSTYIEVGQWYHFAFVNNNSNSITDKIFINGSLDSHSIRSPYVGAPTQVTIGGGVHSTINGLIDEVRIYNRALSDAEIQAIYNATK